MALPLMPTSLVGSYAQPDWLIDKARLGQRLPPRVILHELWRVPEEHLLEAQNDATIIALDDQHRAGVDIVTDGEMRRESYSNRFANALDGVDLLAALAGLGVKSKYFHFRSPLSQLMGPVYRKLLI